MISRSCSGLRSNENGIWDGFHTIPRDIVCFLLVPCYFQASIGMQGSASWVDIFTKLGNIRGFVVDTGRSVTTRFLGIPYAQPPTGNRRFRGPSKHSGWSSDETYNATFHRPSCPGSQFQQRTDEHTNEDCLYLNIFYPGNLRTVAHANTQNFPVLVFFSEPHNSETDRFVGHFDNNLLDHQRFVLVSIQYRIGVFGYFSISDESNHGLRDQQRALHWIWDNIREFGGDPEQITIVGSEDAGIHVSLHVLSPDSKGLFARAIIQSGTVLAPGAVQRNASGMRDMLIDMVGCSSNTSECLVAVPLQELLEVASKVGEVHGERWSVSVNGETLPAPPKELLANGKFNSVDILIGVDMDAGCCGRVDEPSLEQISRKLFKTRVADALRNSFKSPDVAASFQIAEEVVLLEYAGCGSTMDRLCSFYTDFYHLVPTVLTARSLSTKSNVFYYVFKDSANPCPHPPDLPGIRPCPGWWSPVSTRERTLLSVRFWNDGKQGSYNQRREKGSLRRLD